MTVIGIFLVNTYEILVKTTKDYDTLKVLEDIIEVIICLCIIEDKVK